MSRHGFLCSALVLLAVSNQALAGDDAKHDRHQVGDAVLHFTLPAVNFESLKIDGQVSLDDYFGESAKHPKKITLISFFATHCELCKREMPYIAALYDIYGDKGMQALIVTIDKEQSKVEEAQHLTEAAGIKFPLLNDRFNIVAKRFLVKELPCVYMIDAVGKVVWVNIGDGDDVRQTLLAQIRKHIGEPVSDPVPHVLQRYIEERPATKIIPDNVGSISDTKKRRIKRRRRRNRRKRRNNLRR